MSNITTIHLLLITSCSSVVRALVCQLNGPGSILAVPFKSAITKGKTQLAAANHHHSVAVMRANDKQYASASVKHCKVNIYIELQFLLQLKKP